LAKEIVRLVLLGAFCHLNTGDDCYSSFLFFLTKPRKRLPEMMPMITN
jgi:hypothetical protein